MTEEGIGEDADYLEALIREHQLEGTKGKKLDQVIAVARALKADKTHSGENCQSVDLVVLY